MFHICFHHISHEICWWTPIKSPAQASAAPWRFRRTPLAARWTAAPPAQRHRWAAALAQDPRALRRARSDRRGRCGCGGWLHHRDLGTPGGMVYGFYSGCTHIETRSGFCDVLVLDFWCLVELNVPQAFGCRFFHGFSQWFWHLGYLCWIMERNIDNLNSWNRLFAGPQN